MLTCLLIPFLCIGTFSVFVLLVLELLWLPFAVLYEDESQPCMGSFMLFHFPHGNIFTVIRLPLVFVVVWMISVARTDHMRLAAGYVLLNWASAVWALLSTCVALCNGPFHKVHVYYVQGVVTREGQIWTDPVIALFICLVLWWGFVLYTTRVEAVEATALQSFGIRKLRPILALALPFIPLLSIFFALDKLKVPYARLLFLGDAAVLVGFWVAATFLYVRALIRIMSVAAAALRLAPAWVAPAAQKVNVAMRKEILCLALSFSSSLLNVTVWLTYVFFRPYYLQVTVKAVSCLDAFCNVAFALMLCGVSSGKHGASKRAELARKRLLNRSRALLRWAQRSLGKGEVGGAWQEKIEELSERGVSLSALLAFYRDLPRLMPAYDSGRHTTADVVFQAIIPMTRDRKCAAAELLMDCAPTKPDKMVTHSWGNVFRDLLAGILADAFGDAEYIFFCELLDYEMPILERWVEHAGIGKRTYWICAFSVNQHRGVCSNESVKDSVTGRQVPACTCGLEKAWNNTAPTLPDGRSVPCEMNKFDDMMRLLASASPLFSQAVVIDAAFTTFNRAWCIAELATAKELGMRQDLKIGFAPQLEDHEEELKNLHIQDMRASRPEDKAEILANIDDPAAFDQAMQKLIWEDLLPSWSNMDAVERMAAGGRIIRWFGTEAWTNNPSVKALRTLSIRRSTQSAVAVEI